jgi:hypothetical protein
MSCWVYQELEREWKWLVDSQDPREIAQVGNNSAEVSSTVKVFWEMAAHRLSCRNVETRTSVTASSFHACVVWEMNRDSGLIQPFSWYWASKLRLPV